MRWSVAAALVLLMGVNSPNARADEVTLVELTSQALDTFCGPIIRHHIWIDRRRDPLKEVFEQAEAAGWVHDSHWVWTKDGSAGRLQVRMSYVDCEITVPAGQAIGQKDALIGLASEWAQSSALLPFVLPPDRSSGDVEKRFEGNQRFLEAHAYDHSLPSRSALPDVMIRGGVANAA